MMPQSSSDNDTSENHTQERSIELLNGTIIANIHVVRIV